MACIPATCTTYWAAAPPATFAAARRCLGSCCSGAEAIRTVCIIQARLGSTRLPGKVLADIAGRSMLARVVERARRAMLVDDVVVATSDQPSDAAVAAECGRLRAPCVRGSEHDVLDRFYRAAIESRAEVVVRITADCPFVDPGLIDLVLAHFNRQGVDHAGILTSGRCAYPRGLDAEAIAREALDCAWRDARATHERAHVTPYLYGRPGMFRTLTVRPDVDHSQHRWTVDTPADLRLARALYSELGDDGGFSWRDVLRVACQRPELARLNRHVRHKLLIEG